MRDVISAEQEQEIRKAYAAGDLYDPRRICLKVEDDPQTYADRLLVEKLTTVRRFYRGGRVLDLCCATGEHLFTLGGVIAQGIGLDFSHRYIEAATKSVAERAMHKIAFVQGDARELPFKAAEFGLVYSFSSLYAIPNV